MKNVNKTSDEYSKLVKRHRPGKPKLRNFIMAYLVGGLICAFGQVLINTLMAYGMAKDAAVPMTSIILIFLGVLATGFGIYDELGQFAGAGAAVPVTGFANAIASPAIEFRQEGWILGLGAKMYVVAGPVLTYGMVTAFLMGVLKTIFKF